MLRTLCFVLVGSAALALVALGGEVGPVDLTDVPLPMIGFTVVTGLVLFGLSRI